MKYLTRYVVVRSSGDWHFMGEETKAREWFALMQKHNRADGFRLERWVYPIMADGTHGTPTKTGI